MKKFYLTLLLALFFMSQTNAQTPETFQYQSIVKDDSGNLMSGADVSFKFKIHQAEASGSVVFQEKHTTKTSVGGVATLQIGKGVNEHGMISQINWANGPYFMEIEVDKGAGFVNIGTHQILSVPYAQYAKRAENVLLKSPNGKLWNVIINNDGTISTQEVQ